MDWNSLKTRAVENAVWPIAAAMFWAIIVLLVLFAVAEDRHSALNTFFVAFGAIGQVAIAFLLYRVSAQQLDHNRQSTDRQTRIALFGARTEIVNEFQTAMRGAILKPSENLAIDLYSVYWQIEQPFGVNEQKLISEFIDLYEDYSLFAIENELLLTDKDMDGGEARRGFMKRRSSVRTSQITLIAALRKATAIDP